MKKVYMCVTLCLIGGMLLGCGGGYEFPDRNHRADDMISRAIYEELGKEVLYQGREIKEDKSVCYKYYVKEQSDQLGRIRVTVQEIIEQEEIDDKVCITCWKKFSEGHTCVAEFYNYSDGSGGADLEGLQRLLIIGNAVEEDSIYNQPDTYSGIQGIKYLQVKWDMADIIEKENIDWNEYFLDLETLEVVPTEK